jgi:hypothetical protein
MIFNAVVLPASLCWRFERSFRRGKALERTVLETSFLDLVCLCPLFDQLLFLSLNCSCGTSTKSLLGIQFVVTSVEFESFDDAPLLPNPSADLPSSRTPNDYSCSPGSISYFNTGG